MHSPKIKAMRSAISKALLSGDGDAGDAQFMLQVQMMRPITRSSRVQAGGGLVEEQDSGLQGNGPGSPHAASCRLSSAGFSAWVPMPTMDRHSSTRSTISAPVIPAAAPQGEGHVLEHGHGIESAAIWKHMPMALRTRRGLAIELVDDLALDGHMP